LKTHTSILVPLQVKEAIVLWARLNYLIGEHEEVVLTDIEIRKDGSAAIKKKVPP
jgi:hypothetical protein